MTEAEWLVCPDPREMLTFLDWGLAGHEPSMPEGFCRRITQRKLRLFACACCRHNWDRLTDERSRRAVEVAEQFADGAASDVERAAAHAGSVEAYQAWYRAWAARLPDTLQGKLDRARYYLQPEHGLLNLVKMGSGPEPAEGLNLGLFSDYLCFIHTYDMDDTAGREAANRPYAGLLRDILGSSFRPVSVGRALLAWNDGTVPALAGGISREGRFQDLPILADALEEAGCADPAILAHCRQPGNHARGCWVLDLVTSKS